MKKRTMISFAEALQIMRSHAACLDEEPVRIEHASNRIVSRPVVSDISMPPFPRSTRDGYACRKEDMGDELEIVETIYAGKTPQKSIHPKQCAKIMTGAPVPSGADCVFMIEHSESVSDTRVRCTTEFIEDHICPAGEDMKAGDTVMQPGERLTPGHLAVLSAVGCVEPHVYKKPRVGILETGDELVQPHDKPVAAQIRAGIRFPLQAQLMKANADVRYYGIAADNIDSLTSSIQKMQEECDVLLIAGGVSMGELDLVPDVLASLGYTIHFNSVAIQPGKPTTFARSSQAYFFGLPGNPVSSLVQCELFVKPFLYALQGHAYEALEIHLPMANDYSRKSASREAWFPVMIASERDVTPLDFHSSAHVQALCRADGLMNIPIHCTHLPKGTFVKVRFFDHG